MMTYNRSTYVLPVDTEQRHKLNNKALAMYATMSSDADTYVEKVIALGDKDSEFPTLLKIADLLFEASEIAEQRIRQLVMKGNINES